MAKVTVTIEGDEREVGRVLRRLMKRRHDHEGGCGGPRDGCGHGPKQRHRHGMPGVAPEGPGEAVAGGPPPEMMERRGPRHRHGHGRRSWWAELEGLTPWTQAELQSLWSEVTDGARKVLAELAKRPGGYSNVELQQVLGMPGNAIGGTLSSAGVAARKFGPKPPLYFFRWETYRMLPDVAAALSQLAGQPPADPAQ
jgi:hypothetical protein